MDIAHPATVLGAGAAAVVVAIAVTSVWWSRKLGQATRMVERLKAAREQLLQQNGQARRQIEQLQLEMTELRLLAERARRRTSNSVSPPDTLNTPPAPPPAPAPRAVDPNSLLLNDRNDLAPAAGFAQTQFEQHDASEERDDTGFAPTQVGQKR